MKLALDFKKRYISGVHNVFYEFGIRFTSMIHLKSILSIFANENLKKRYISGVICLFRNVFYEFGI
jgi:hypothetical protein